ncbi:hypothetical protein HDU67_006284 [Dinochytrium kinnereticum]|nr:hypothetical protein HDU67_006284 [Dinochytrium kinnereticum]
MKKFTTISVGGGEGGGEGGEDSDSEEEDDVSSNEETLSEDWNPLAAADEADIEMGEGSDSDIPPEDAFDIVL